MHHSIPLIHTLIPLPAEQFGTCAHQGCEQRALAACGLTIPSLLGPLNVFFCFPDYLSMVKILQAIDSQGINLRQAVDTFLPLRQRIVPLAPRLLGGDWPSREELMSQWEAARIEYDHSRHAYQHATTTEEHRLRIQAIHRAALFLFAALCLEDRPRQDRLSNQVVNATWAQVVSPFLTEERMVLFEKEITRSHVLIALVAIVFCRIDGSRNEEVEQAILAQVFQETAQEEPSWHGDEHPEFQQALLLLSAQINEQEHPQQRYWGPLSEQKREEQRKRARENVLLAGGLRRLSEKIPPTVAQTPLVRDYIQTFLSQITILKQQLDSAIWNTEDWQDRYIRLTKEWNAMLVETERSESS